MALMADIENHRADSLKCQIPLVSSVSWKYKIDEAIFTARQDISIIAAVKEILIVVKGCYVNKRSRVIFLATASTRRHIHRTKISRFVVISNKRIEPILQRQNI